MCQIISSTHHWQMNIFMDKSEKSYTHALETCWFQDPLIPSHAIILNQPDTNVTNK